MKTFAERFNEAMKLRNVNQAWVAKETSIAPGTISNWSCGKYSPKEDNLRIIAEALNVSESYLRGYTESPERLDDSDMQSFMELFNDQTYKATHPVALSSEDYDVIIAYQKSDEKTRKAVRIMLGVEV